MLRICGTSPQRMKTCGWIGMPGYELLVNKSRSGYMRLRETAAHQDANERGPADSPDFCKLESESRDRGVIRDYYIVWGRLERSRWQQ